MTTQNHPLTLTVESKKLREIDMNIFTRIIDFLFNKDAKKPTVFQDVDDSAHYPFLVYGTLRPGGGNFEYFLADKDLTNIIDGVTLTGLTMYANGTAYPYAVQDEAGSIQGTLVYVSDEDYVEAQEGLDYLEGFYGFGDTTNHYDRKLVTFTHNGERITAWVYVAYRKRDYITEFLKVVPGGDWLAFAEANKTHHGTVWG